MDKYHRIIRGQNENKVDIDTLKNEFAQYLQIENLNFLIGSGCSSCVIKGAEQAVPTMYTLFENFFSKNPGFLVGEVDAYSEFDHNLENMLDFMIAMRLINEKIEVDTGINEKIKCVQNFIRESIVSGTSCADVLDVYKQFYLKTIRNNRKTPINVFTTNYDLYNEKALDSLGFYYNNGFSGTYNRKFNPMSYSYAFVENMNLNKGVWQPVSNFYNLFKIHGSITWVSENEEIHERNHEFIKPDDALMIYPIPLKDRATLMTPYVNTADGIRFVGEISSYVSIDDIGRKIVAEVVGVDEKTGSVSHVSMNKPNSNKYIHLNLIGEIIGSKFFFGVSKMPLIFSEIRIITEKDLRIMLEIETDEQIIAGDALNTRAVSLAIGQSVIFSDYQVRVNIDKFFGFHFSVFGNTGAGKSNTIARILQNIFQKTNFAAKGAKFIIIDSNGEYKAAFENINHDNVLIKSKMISADDNACDIKLEIPVWALSADDWAVLLHASEKTQIPILRRAIDIAKIFFDPLNDDNNLKNHILASTVLGVLNSSDSSPSKSDKLKAILTTFSTSEINLDIQCSDGRTIRHCVTNNYGQLNDIEQVQKLCEQYIQNEISGDTQMHRLVVYDLNQFSEAVTFAVLYEGSISSQRIQEYTATLTTRLQALRDSDQGNILTKTNYTNIDDYVYDLVGENQILNIDISSLDDSTCEVVTKVVAKIIFDYLKKREKKADMPVNLIIEEAHRFIKNENSFGALGYNIFERIAKEGRKFGLLLGISSQRPSELSKTVVSQCSNFIIHRVQNPDDLTYISRMVPYISDGIINRLTYLQTGHALVFGTAVNLPTLTKFDIAVPSTDSENARISDKWYVM